MKIACVIFLYDKEDSRFLDLTLQLAKSIRRYDDIPIHIMSPKGLLTDEGKQELIKNSLPYWEEELIRQLRFLPYELTKIRAVRHIEYDKILLLDADSLAISSVRPLFDLPAVAAPVWKDKAPFLASKVLLEPNEHDYNKLCEIVQKGFTSTLGWNHNGLLPHWKTEKAVEWNFPGADASQGLFYYYYQIMQHKFFPNNLDAIKHFGRGPKRKWPLGCARIL